MTTTEMCNSYQMSITVTAILSFISGRYCAKGNFFLIFFSAKEVPFLKVRLRKKDVCRYHFQRAFILLYSVSFPDLTNMICITLST